MTINIAKKKKESGLKQDWLWSWKPPSLASPSSWTEFPFALKLCDGNLLATRVHLETDGQSGGLQHLQL